MSAVPACPHCAAPWPVVPGEATGSRACPSCQRPGGLLIFSALHRLPPVEEAAASLVVEGEASCFYHPGKRAAIPCGSCGRFLCALCDVKIGGRNLCPACVESGRTKGRFTELETGRTLWDTTALMLAVLPLVLCFYVSVVTAPAALVVSWVGWKKPSSVVPRGQWRFWVAIIAALLQIAGWIGLVVFLVVKT